MILVVVIISGGRFGMNDKKLIKIMDEVANEFLWASSRYPPHNSAHESCAILQEEYEELWDEVKMKSHNKKKMRKEAVQIAAMAMRFIYDVIEVE